MQLSNEEKETIITFDETPEEATVSTYNRRWQKHFEKKLGIKPIDDNGFGCKTYKIAKNRLPLPRAPRRLSEKQKRENVERLNKARHHQLPKGK